jgi:hypothetical protein
VLNPSAFHDDSWLVQMNMQWGNVWILKPDFYMVDCEWAFPTLTLGHRWADNWTAAMRIPVVIRWAGFADSAIERFHACFSLPNHQRDQFPENRSLVAVRNGDHSFQISGSHVGIGDIELLTSWRAVDDARFIPGVVFQASWQLPTGDETELEGTGDSSFTASILMEKRFGTSPFSLFGGGTFTYRLAEEIAAVAIRPTGYSGLLGCEVALDTWDVVVQGASYSPAGRDYYAFSRNALEASLGVRKHIGRSTLECSLTENVKYFSSGSDIGAQIGWNRSF